MELCGLVIFSCSVYIASEKKAEMLNYVTVYNKQINTWACQHDKIVSFLLFVPRLYFTEESDLILCLEMCTINGHKGIALLQK